MMRLALAPAVLVLAGLTACVAHPGDTSARRFPAEQARGGAAPDPFDQARQICGPVPVKRRPENERTPEDRPQDYSCDFERVGL